MEFVHSTEVAVEKGRKLGTWLRIGEQPNGAPIELPVITVGGVNDGPTFYVNAAMHGDEILGTDVMRHVVRDLDPAKMSGTLVTIPMSNPLATATRTRRNIIEMYPGPHDMNRVFPASADGVLTERIAALIADRFIAEADYAFDLHAASVGGAWHAYSAFPKQESCATPEVYEKSAMLAKAFGAPNILGQSMFHGSLVDHAVRTGTPASMAEFGVANFIDEDERAMGIRGVTNLLKVIGIIEGEPEIPEGRRVLKKVHRIRTDVFGFLIHEVPIGSDVKAGTRLARLENLAGQVTAEFSAPADGRVCRINTMGTVGTGDIICYLAETEPVD